MKNHLQTSISTAILMMMLAAFGTGLNAQCDSVVVNKVKYYVDDYSSVHAIKKSGNTIYLGGKFNYFTRQAGMAAPVNATTGVLPINFPEFIGSSLGRVQVIIPDGSGGWFAGGNFTKVGGKARQNLVHINGSYEVTNLLERFRTDGTVRSLHLNGGNLYIGGDFTHVGDFVFSGAVAFNTTSGETNWSFPEFNGDVNKIIPDGNGGWFLGGSFTKVGSIDHSYLAQLNSSGQLTNFAPQPNGTVSSLLLSGNILYVAGGFSAIGGESRQGVAAIDVSTGLAIPGFNANVSTGSYVIELGLQGTTLYMSGGFTAVNAQARYRLASVNAITGAVTNWDPNPNYVTNISALQIANNRLFVAGDFSTIAGSDRQFLCSFNITDPSNVSLEAWDPKPDGIVTELHVNGNTLYVGGQFRLFPNPSPVYRNRAASIDILTNTITAWNPNCSNGGVQAIHTNGNSVYLGGEFTRINGSPTDNCRRIAVVNDTDGTLNGFAPEFHNSSFNDIETGPPGEIFVGTSYYYGGGRFRAHICSVNATTGQPTNWNPGTGRGSVNDITSSGSLLYLAGNFKEIGVFPNSIVTREGVAAFDLPSGNLNAGFNFSGNSNGTVLSIALQGSILYLGGDFTTINGASRNHIASADATTGMISSWNPDANSGVTSIVPTDTAIYAGGSFSNIGSQDRSYLASLDPATGEASAAFFQTSGSVSKLALQSNIIYVTGSFYDIGTTTPDQQRSHGASIDISTNTLTSFELGGNGEVYTIALNGMNAYVGGSFTRIGLLRRRGLCALDATTGELTSWNPQVSGNIYALEIIGSTIYAGGDFATNLAAIDTSGNVLPGFNPGLNNTVKCLAASGTNIFAGGDFYNVNGRNYLIQLDGTTGATTSWINNPYGSNPYTTIINTIKIANDSLLIGGSFNEVNGISRSNLAIVSATNSNSTMPWYPGVYGLVNSIEKAGSKIFIGGVFHEAGGKPRNNIAAFDLPSGNISDWNPNISGYVGNTLYYSNGRLYAGGEFSSVGGFPRKNLCSIDAASGLPTSWKPDPNDDISSILVESGNIYVGGSFTNINGANTMIYAQLADNCCALYYWSGTGNWSNTANWCNGLVPVDSIDAVIESGSVTVAGATSVRKLTILIGASANIPDGQTLTLFGDIDNRGGSLGGAGTLQFSGNNPKYINGTVNIANLNYNMTGANLSLSNGSLNVSGTLSFNTDGFINLFGDGNLRLTGTSSSIAGYNSNRNILLTGGGNINSKFTIEHIGTGGRTGDVIFPVSLNGSYVPVTINNSGTSDNFSIRLVSGVYDAYDANGNPTGLLKNHDVVGITWLIDEEVAGGNNASITLQWPLALETYNFNRNAVSLRRYTGSAWNNDNGPIGAASGSDPYTYSRIGISSFSPFSLGSGAAFPLNFLSFSGRKMQSSIALSWVTDNEVNTSHFDIERSADGLIFTSIGKVSAANQGGQHNYAFTDPQPKRGVNFYRLRQVDLDGGFMFSNTISLTMDGFGVPGIWPNPVKDELRITGMDVSAMSQLQVIDASGRMVKQFTPSSSQLYTIPELPAGIYILKIMRKDQTSLTLRFMKQ